MENLKVIESGIVPVYQTDMGERIVYGTELYIVLEDKTKYTDWISRRFDECDAEENKDYEVFLKNEKNSNGGRPTVNHIIQLTTAKEMAMLERNDKGKQVRRYFISIEEKYKEIAAKGHSVKQLTVTSRDMAKMLGKIHPAILNLIRECMGELQMQGFDTSRFFQESTYTSEKNREGIVQFLCTEEGCMCIANKLEPDARQAFISEFTDRFERMRDCWRKSQLNGLETPQKPSQGRKPYGFTEAVKLALSPCVGNCISQGRTPRS